MRAMSWPATTTSTPTFVFRRQGNKFDRQQVYEEEKLISEYTLDWVSSTKLP